MSDLHTWLQRMCTGLEELRDLWQKRAVFSPAEVATILGVPAKTVHALVADGRLQTNGSEIPLDALADFLRTDQPDKPWQPQKHENLPSALRAKLDPLIGLHVGARILGYSNGASLTSFAAKLKVPLHPHPRNPQYRSIRASHLLVLWKRRASAILKSRRDSTKRPSITPLDLRKTITHPDLVLRWTTGWARTIALPKKWPHECTRKRSK